MRGRESCAGTQPTGLLLPVIMFDNRGTVMSDRTERLPDHDRCMLDFGAVLDAAGSEPAALFAVSEAGPFPSSSRPPIPFVAAHPERASAGPLEHLRPDHRECRLSDPDPARGAPRVLPLPRARVVPTLVAAGSGEGRGTGTHGSRDSGRWRRIAPSSKSRDGLEDVRRLGGRVVLAGGSQFTALPCS